MPSPSLAPSLGPRLGAPARSLARPLVGDRLRHGAARALLVACLLAAAPGLGQQPSLEADADAAANAAADTEAAANAEAADTAAAADAARGKTLFAAYRCYACHGYTGETGPGPRLNPPRLDRAQFIAYVRNPGTRYRNDGNVGGVMPPYAADDVSDQDLADVYAYLASLPSYSPPAESLGLEGP